MKLDPNTFVGPPAPDTSSHTTNYSDGRSVTRSSTTTKIGRSTRTVTTVTETPGRGSLSSGQVKGVVGGIFRILVTLLLFVMFLRILQGRDIPTLTDLLLLFERAPVIPSDWLSVFNAPVSSYIPDGFLLPKILVTMIERIIGSVFTMSVITINLVLYVGYFVLYLFL